MNESKPSRSQIHNVRFYGATGDGRTLDTEAINQAISSAAEEGGGTVLVPAGEYLSHSLRLRSNITLRISAGATIVAAEPPQAGQTGGYDAPEKSDFAHHQDFGHTYFRNSLIWGEDLENVVLEGPGRLYGRGLSRGNGRKALPVGETAPCSPDRLPDVLEADGPVDVDWPDSPPPGPFGYPNSRDTLPAGVGNKALALNRCRNVTLRDFSILHGGHFAILASGCSNLTIENLVIDTNRDGIDIDACCNVRVSNCSVNSPWDDGICLKASLGCGERRPLENVTISDCFLSGFVEGTLLDGTRRRLLNQRGGPIGRIKFGTEGGGGFRNVAITNCVFEFCRGIALEQVDGSVLEDVVISNIVMRQIVNSPLFVRLGGRLMAPGATAPGAVRRIRISNIVAHDIAPDHGVFIAGLAGFPVEDLQIQGLLLEFRGGGTAEQAKREVPEIPKGYPEPYLFGTLPAWGFFVRHARDLVVKDVTLRLMERDERPVLHLEDLSRASFDSVFFPDAPAAASWIQKNTGSIRIRNCSGQADIAGS